MPIGESGRRAHGPVPEQMNRHADTRKRGYSAAAFALKRLRVSVDAPVAMLSSSYKLGLRRTIRRLIWGKRRCL
jgi:hypothetical protein